MNYFTATDFQEKIEQVKDCLQILLNAKRI